MREKAEAEKREKEYQNKMREQLLKSGLSEKEINAVLEGKRISKEKEEKEKKEKKEKEKETVVESHTQIVEYAPESSRPTYTRMARRHLSIETLRQYTIAFQIDAVSCRSLLPFSL